MQAASGEFAFPHGDALGVVLSFLSARELLYGGLFRVNKEWWRVLCTLPHAWGLSLDLSRSRGSLPSWSKCMFAWHRIRVSHAERFQHTAVPRPRCHARR